MSNGQKIGLKKGIAMTDRDFYFMKKAINEAKKALARDEVPIGALVVDQNGTIVGRGFNMVETKKQQSAHAEVIALNKACKQQGDWRLDQCTLYITLEPCMMCMGLIRLSRIVKIVYGADSRLFGYSLDKEEVLPLYKRDIEIKKGIYQEEIINLLQQFFKEKRKKRE